MSPSIQKRPCSDLRSDACFVGQNACRYISLYYGVGVFSADTGIPSLETCRCEAGGGNSCSAGASSLADLVAEKVREVRRFAFNRVAISIGLLIRRYIGLSTNKGIYRAIPNFTSDFWAPCKAPKRLSMRLSYVPLSADALQGARKVTGEIWTVRAAFL